MDKRLNVDALLKFLSYSGFKLYFERDPFLKGGSSVSINTIDESLLISKVKDFNLDETADSLEKFK
jgi:hypothetical protein